MIKNKNKYRVVKVEYRDIKTGFKNISLDSLKLEHVNIPLPVICRADLIVYVSPNREMKLLKDRHGAIGTIIAMDDEEAVI